MITTLEATRPTPTSPPSSQLSPIPGPLAIPSTNTPMLPLKLEKPVYSSPPPASSNPENNTCKLLEYRGHKVAAFSVDCRELICLPQAFDLFLKHLVGGLHTVYTKLKRLDITPIVCNVEQVRILRGLGAIQPGVNRCKLISPKEFDVLYDDCTNSSARPGRPPKRSALNATPDALEKLKKSRLDNGDYGYPPTSLMDLKKSPLFGNGYHYPPHFPFMPMAHPAMVNLAMASHLAMRPENMMASRENAAQDLSSPRKDDRMDPGHIEHNNNKPLDMDKPLDLGTHTRAEIRRPSTTDRDSVASSVSEVVMNSHIDMCARPPMMQHHHDDLDLDDDSEDDKDDDEELEIPNLSRSIPNGEATDKSTTNQALGYTSQILNSDSSGLSSVDTLLINIQGLLKVAAENARHREQQINFEKAELKMEILKERELRENIEKQLAEEQRNRVVLQKRLKKEKKARRRMQDQLEVIGQNQCQGQSHNVDNIMGHNGTEDHLKMTQENLRMLNEGQLSRDMESDRLMTPETERKLPDPRPPTSIHSLMETFLSSTQRSSPTCNGAASYLASPVIKQTDSA